MPRGFRAVPNFNKEFFEVSSPQLAYFMGIMAADGNVMGKSGGYRILLRLSSRDEEILVKVREWLGLRSVICRCTDTRWKKVSKNSSICFYSKWAVNWLESRGIVRRKSKLLGVVGFPEGFDAEFVRGYFDGDGCLTSRDNGRGHRYEHMNFFGTELAMGFIEGLIKKNLGLVPRHYKQRSLHHIRYACRGDVAKLKGWMNRSGFGMRRKIDRSPVAYL